MKHILSMQVLMAVIKIAEQYTDPMFCYPLQQSNEDSKVDLNSPNIQQQFHPRLPEVNGHISPTIQMSRPRKMEFNFHGKEWTQPQPMAAENETIIPFKTGATSPSIFFDSSDIQAFKKPAKECHFPTCKTIETGLEESDKKIILKAHNSFREKVANGKQKGFPTASNMNEMYWDKELQKNAQRHADTCVFEHTPKECQKPVRDFKQIGENLFQLSSSSKTESQIWDEAITEFYNEYKHYSPTLLKKFSINPPSARDKMIGHFTQLIWATSTHVGCGYTKYKTPKDDPNASRAPYTELYVCHYGPAGNWMRKPVYKEGKPCSECSSGKCSTKYEGLCKT